MPENKTIISVGYDENGLPEASIEATGEPYERVMEDIKKIVEYLIQTKPDYDEYEDDEEYD